MNTKYTATEVVKDMYDSYPEVDFIDERYTDDDKTVDLIFDISRVDDIQSLLTKIENEYGCAYKTKGNSRLIITADEDDEYYLDDTDYDMTERHDDNSLNEWWYDKASADNWGMNKKNSENCIKNSGFTLEQIVPNMEQLYHIWQAKQKADSGQTRGCGINYNSIKDPIKYAQYIYAASVLEHTKYLNKTWYQSEYDRPKTPNSNYFSDRLFNCVDYLGLCDTTLKPQFDAYLVEREKLEKEKEAKRKVRAVRKAATGNASATTTTTATANPGQITKQNWDAGQYYPDSIFQKVVNDGCNVNIDRIISQNSTRRVGKSSYAVPNKISKITITDKDTGAVLYEKEIIVSAPSGSFDDDLKVYSSDEFSGLPERQFSAWLKRKIDQAREEKAAVPQTTSDAEVTDSETTEVQDED